MVFFIAVLNDNINGFYISTTVTSNIGYIDLMSSHIIKYSLYRHRKTERRKEIEEKERKEEEDTESEDDDDDKDIIITDGKY